MDSPPTNTTSFVMSVQPFRNMIVNCIEEKCISALCYPIIRFNTCTPLNLMEHIWNTYGKITTSDLTAKEERMCANWNPPTPIETLYEQFIDGQQFAMQVGETFHDSQLIRKGIWNNWKNRIIHRRLQGMEKKAEDEEIFENFKQFFTAADDDRRKNNGITRSSGFSVNLSSTTKWITSFNSGCNLMTTQIHHQQHQPINLQIQSQLKKSEIRLSK